jgi:hypothetical protein
MAEMWRSMVEHEPIQRLREADWLLAYDPGEPLDGEREFTRFSARDQSRQGR